MVRYMAAGVLALLIHMIAFRLCIALGLPTALGLSAWVAAVPASLLLLISSFVGFARSGEPDDGAEYVGGSLAYGTLFPGYAILYLISPQNSRPDSGRSTALDNVLLSALPMLVFYLGTYLKLRYGLTWALAMWGSIAMLAVELGIFWANPAPTFGEHRMGNGHMT